MLEPEDLKAFQMQVATFSNTLGTALARK